MDDFWMQMVLSFFMSLGMLLGGSVLGALGALLAGGYPATTMLDLADQLKTWAAVAALGGTFATIKMIDSVLWGQQTAAIFRHMSLVVAAFGGAQLGYLLVEWMAGSP